MNRFISDPKAADGNKVAEVMQAFTGKDSDAIRHRAESLYQESLSHIARGDHALDVLAEINLDQEQANELFDAIISNDKEKVGAIILCRVRAQMILELKHDAATRAPFGLED